MLVLSRKAPLLSVSATEARGMTCLTNSCWLKELRDCRWESSISKTVIFPCFRSSTYTISDFYNFSFLSRAGTYNKLPIFFLTSNFFENVHIELSIVRLLLPHYSSILNFGDCTFWNFWTSSIPILYEKIGHRVTFRPVFRSREKKRRTLFLYFYMKLLFCSICVYIDQRNLKILD